MFDYIAVHSISEALAVLSRPGKCTRILAGGTDLLVKLREGREHADLVVDIKPIPETTELIFHPANGLRLGAAVSCMRLRKDPAISAAYPGLIDAVSLIGSAQVQGRASVGGNLCSAAPSGDSIPVMIVLEAVCTTAGPQGIRTTPVKEFCTGPGKTILQEGEFLLYFDFPPSIPNTGSRYLRFTPREEMDIAVVGVAVWIALESDLQTIQAARIALGTVAPQPTLIQNAGLYLVGKPVSEMVFRSAAQICRSGVSPRTTMRGTAKQRSHLVEVLVRRALWNAVCRARGEPLYVA